MPLPDLATPPSPSARACLSRRARTRAAFRGLALLAAAAAPLGACTRPDAFAPACPQLSMLKDGADLIRFTGAGRDITDLVVDAHLTAVPASCRWAD